MKKLRTLLKNQKGFTLIELLVVIAIIGILATLVLLQLGTARSRARDAKRIADVSQLRAAIELYYEDNNGAYPADITTANLSKYLTNVPVDPLNSALTYGYKTKDANKYSYQIWTELEQKAGGALGGDGDIAASAWTGPGNTRGGTTGATETCPDSDLTNANCVYDLGTVAN
ncbi:MAG: type II secretion system protein [Patescibacteria group bacterium]